MPSITETSWFGFCFFFKVYNLLLFTPFWIWTIMFVLNLSRLGMCSVITSASGFSSFTCRSQIFVILVHCLKLMFYPLLSHSGVCHGEKPVTSFYSNALFSCHVLCVWLHTTTLSGGGMTPGKILQQPGRQNSHLRVRCGFGPWALTSLVSALVTGVLYK